ncbi:MAG: nitroreductase family protein [Spirochaetaceae bacterium]
MMEELTRRNRSYRRFDETRSLTRAHLHRWIERARYAASAMNAQPLRYILSADPSTNDSIFPLLKWAGYLTDWDGPAEGERPTGYIVALWDTEVKVKPEFAWCDLGLASENILLSATEEGFGGCIIASVDFAALREALSFAERYEPLAVIALGAPAETAVVVDLPADGSIKYYRDESGTHYVPKRATEDLVISPRLEPGPAHRSSFEIE